MKSLNLLIIGAGLAGSCVAREAASRGATVTVIEKANAPATKASGAAAGALHPLTGMRLSVQDIRFKAFRLTQQWLQNSDPSLYQRPGILRLASSEEQAKLWKQKTTEIPAGFISWLDHQTLHERFPKLTKTPTAGVLIHQGTFVDVPRWVQHNLKHPNITLATNTHVADIQEHHDHIRLQSEHGSSWDGDLVVVAAGTATRPPLIDMKLEWLNYKGEMGVFTGIEAPPVPLNHRGYITRWGDRGVLVGVVDSRPPFESGLQKNLETQLLHRAQAIWNGVSKEATLVNAWSGVRPALTSHTPKVGSTRDSDRIFICVGHGGKGLLNAPLSAVGLCDMIEGKTPSLPPSWRTR